MSFSPQMIYLVHSNLQQSRHLNSNYDVNFASLIKVAMSSCEAARSPPGSTEHQSTEDK